MWGQHPKANTDKSNKTSGGRKWVQGGTYSLPGSCVSHSVDPWTVVCQLLCPWNSPGKNTRVGCHSLLQGIFQTQGWKLSLLYCRQTLHHLNHQGSPGSKLFSNTPSLTPMVGSHWGCLLLSVWRGFRQQHTAMEIQWGVYAKAIPALPPSSSPLALPLISKIQKLESLMCKSKATEIPRALRSVLMNVLKGNVIREVRELRRELCSTLMFYGCWWSGGWAETVLFWMIIVWKSPAALTLLLLFFFWLGGYVKVSLTCVADMDNTFN